jgi:hypothetical protein
MVDKNDNVVCIKKFKCNFFYALRIRWFKYLNFYASIMSPLFKFIITQNLKLKYQNKTVRF